MTTDRTESGWTGFSLIGQQLMRIERQGERGVVSDNNHHEWRSWIRIPARYPER